MPGLSDIIDTNTGEVKGGIPAIKAYADEWARMAKYEAQVKGLQEKKALYEGLPEQSDVAASLRSARAEARAYLVGYGRLTEAQADEILAGATRATDIAYGKEAQISNDDTGISKLNYESLKTGSLAYFFSQTPTAQEGSGLQKAENALSKYMLALYDYYEYLDVAPAMEEAYTEAINEQAEAFGISTDKLKDDIAAREKAVNSMTTLQKAALEDAQAMETVENATKSADEALAALAGHVENVYNSVFQSINSVAKSLDSVEFSRFDPAKVEKITKLAEQQGAYDIGSDKWKELQAEIDATNKGLVTTNSIYENLETQATFLDTYLENLQKARGMGLSNELLAELADGSVESAQYLDAIVNDETGKSATEIDKKYREIQEKKAQLAQELSGQQLTVDQTYQALAEKAKEAIAALDLGEEAKENAASTIQGIADGIGEKNADVANAVTGIINELERLNGYGIDIDFGGFGNITFTTSTGKAEGSARMGLFSVPHDDYLARLHEGERVLTAQEAQNYNALVNGGVSGFSLDELGGVMRDNVKPGGNVYLDGRVVGHVISDQQGKSFRQLQRSGWQA